MVSSPGTNSAEAYHNWADLRDVLFNLVRKSGPQQGDKSTPPLPVPSSSLMHTDGLHLCLSRLPVADHPVALALLQL